MANDEGSCRELSAALKPEHVEQIYGEVTQKLVRIFQDERHLQPSGEVDEPTANALNALLKEWGMLDQPTEPATPQSFVVSGQVRREDGLPLQGLQVRAVHEANAGSVRLGEDTTDAGGRYTIRYEQLPGVDSINLRVTVSGEDGVQLQSSELIREAKPLEIVDLIVPSVNITPYRVEGKVASRISASVGGLRIVIMDKGVGGDVQLTQAITDDSGAYQATFSESDLRHRGKAQPDLQARVFAGDAFLGASDVHYNASEHETLNVLLQDKAASALRSEHEALTSALSCEFKGKLGTLKETDEQQDITYLANKTGWDARAVALASLADQFSARTMDDTDIPAIPQAFFYALFRAGLSANEDTLYHTDARTLTSVWKQAAEQGVIPNASTNQIPNLVELFLALSAQKLLTGPAQVGSSSLKEMLTISHLDDAQQATFAQLYTANRADMPTFWKAVGDAFGSEMANRLQVDGKLGFLTINSAPLMQKVHTTAGTNGLSDPLQLAQTGYHRTEPWSQLLTEDVPIPKEIPGDTPETRRANYASYLGAKVHADPALQTQIEEVRQFARQQVRFASRQVAQVGGQPSQAIKGTFIQGHHLRCERSQRQSRGVLRLAPLGQSGRDRFKEVLQCGGASTQQTLAHHFIAHLHRGKRATLFQILAAPDRAEMGRLPQHAHQQGQVQLLQRQPWGATATMALGSLDTRAFLREHQHLLQQVDKLLSQRRATRLQLWQIAFCLDLPQCGIMHVRQSFQVHINAYERIVCSFRSLCNSILNLVVPNGKTPKAKMKKGPSRLLTRCSWNLSGSGDSARYHVVSSPTP